MKINNIKGIIFDYGATIDSNGIHWAEIIRNGYLKAGVNIADDVFREIYVYAERKLAQEKFILPEHNFLDLMRIKISLEFEKLDLDYDTRTQQEMIARYCYDFAANSVAKAKSVIKRISERYPIILVSNFYGNIESVLKDFGILEYFPVIIESAVVGVRKPNPKIFALGVEALGYPSENVLVVGDSYAKDIAPASSLGCQTIWIKGKGWDSKEDEIPHDHIITQFEQLYNFIEL